MGVAAAGRWCHHEPGPRHRLKELFVHESTKQPEPFFSHETHETTRKIQTLFTHESTQINTNQTAKPFLPQIKTHKTFQLSLKIEKLNFSCSFGCFVG
jgi:hypothetical protein